MDIPNESSIGTAEVLHVMYSRHEKPFRPNPSNPSFRNYYIRLQVEGQCEALVGDNAEWETIYPGDLFLFQPGDKCKLLFAPNKKTNQVLSGNYYMVCRGTWLKQWWAAADRPQKAKIALNDKLLNLCKELESEMSRTKKNWAEAAGYLLRTLLILLDRELSEHAHSSNRETFIAQQMKQYIEDQATAQPTVSAIARHVGLSESRASHLFSTVYGLSLIQYAVDVRLNHACLLIKYTNYGLQEIAHLSGFNQYSYFHRAFRKKYGVSPKRLRA